MYICAVKGDKLTPATAKGFILCKIIHRHTRPKSYPCQYVCEGVCVLTDRERYHNNNNKNVNDG